MQTTSRLVQLAFLAFSFYVVATAQECNSTTIRAKINKLKICIPFRCDEPYKYTCIVGYAKDGSGECQKASLIGDNCTRDEDCVVHKHHAFCNTTTNTCKCRSGFHPNHSNFTCLPNGVKSLQESCAKGDKCSLVAECSNVTSTCMCIPGWEPYGSDDQWYDKQYAARLECVQSKNKVGMCNGTRIGSSSTQVMSSAAGTTSLTVTSHFPASSTTSSISISMTPTVKARVATSPMYSSVTQYALQTANAMTMTSPMSFSVTQSKPQIVIPTTVTGPTSSSVKKYTPQTTSSSVTHSTFQTMNATAVTSPMSSSVTQSKLQPWKLATAINPMSSSMAQSTTVTSPSSSSVTQSTLQTGNVSTAINPMSSSVTQATLQTVNATTVWKSSSTAKIEPNLTIETSFITRTGYISSLQSETADMFSQASYTPPLPSETLNSATSHTPPLPSETLNYATSHTPPLPSETPNSATSHTPPLPSETLNYTTSHTPPLPSETPNSATILTPPLPSETPNSVTNHIPHHALETTSTRNVTQKPNNGGKSDPLKDHDDREMVIIPSVIGGVFGAVLLAAIIVALIYRMRRSQHRMLLSDRRPDAKELKDQESDTASVGSSDTTPRYTAIPRPHVSIKRHSIALYSDVWPPVSMDPYRFYDGQRKPASLSET